MTPDWNRDSIMTRIEDFARSNSLVYFLLNEYAYGQNWDGATVSIMSEEVARSSPPYPDGYRTG